MRESFWRRTQGCRTVSRDGRFVIIKDWHTGMYRIKCDGKEIKDRNKIAVLHFPTLRSAKDWCYFR